MSYLVFARKYRPQTFTEILGQGPIVTTLTNAIRQRRIGQAYLFTGPRGTGKTSTARIFAKALNCIEGPTVTPCLKCERCQEITEGRSLDVLEIDGASNRGIDQVRALREHSKFTPVAGTFKVYMIDEVHQITAEGFNALLKILEEPPSHVLFILATTAPHKVPATILSRCQRYDFKRLSLEIITEKLKAIAADEKLQMTPEAILGVSRAASGSLRDAESLLDQLAAFTDGRIREEDIRALLGTVDEDIFVQATTALKGRDAVRLLRIIAEAVNAGTDLIQWVLSFLSFLRNVLVAKVGAGPLGFEDLGQESIQRLSELSKQFSIEELSLIAQALTGVLETMRRVGEPRIPLEMVLVRLSLGESVVAVEDLIARLEKIQERMSGNAPPGFSPAPVLRVGPGEPASRRSLEKLFLIWPKLLERIHEQKASVSAYLSQAYPVALEGSDPPKVVLGLLKGFEFHRDALDRLPVRQLIEQNLNTLWGGAVCCEFRIVEKLPERSPAQNSEIEEQLPPSQEENLPQGGSGGSAKAASFDPSVLSSIAEMFQGRIIGEGG